MEISRRVFLAGTTALAVFGELTLSHEAASGAPPSDRASGTIELPRVTLHGYGTISAAFRAVPQSRFSLTQILCRSVQKTLLTQAKYLSDLACLPGVTRATLFHNGRSIPILHTPSGGAVTCHATGHEVLILAAADEQALLRLVDTVTASVAKPEEFSARTPIPMYLDRWDRYGLLCYFAPDVMPPGSAYLDQTYDYADGLKFVRDHGTGLVVWDYPLVDDHSEGLTNEQAWSWVQENAKKMNIPVHINTQISPPQMWLANRYREQTMLNAPQFLGGYYGVSHDSAGQGAISWLAREAEDAQLGVFQHTVRRFARDPNIVGWLEPHGETYESPQKYFLDSGPFADSVLQEFLKKRYGNLRTLSERWHGDADHYKSWDEVHLPEIADFVGFGPEAIDLRSVWRVKYVPAPDGHTYNQNEAHELPSPPPTATVPPEWYRPDFDDSAWDELIAPGNDRMLFIPRSPLLYRRKLTIPPEWLASKPQVTLVLWDMVNRDSDPVTVYLNGQLIKEQSHLSRDQHWSRFDVTAALQPADNHLVLQMPRAIICYRAYLTKEPLPQYPNLGPHKNAQWVDFVEWNIESRGAQIRRGAEMIRQADPDRSINFMAADDYCEPVKRACQDYGGRFHDTGGMAGYWTEWNTLMMCGVGLPVTAEPGNGAPNPREFQLFWGRWLTEGVTGVHYFQNWGEIAWNPEVLKVFETNRPMYEAVGKYHPPFAKVAVLFSLRNDWLHGFPWTPDPDSHGGYNSVYNAAGQLIHYCPRDGIGATDFGTPTVDRYRVILDSNTSFMDEDLIAGIEKYVRQGGVFITYGQTGRHTPIQPDTWPISRLTGYQVTGMNGWGDSKTVSPVSGQTVFDQKTSPSHIRCSGLRLKQTATDGTDLLTWEDGTVAAGMRKLGAGWIVHFGPMLNGETFVTLIAALLRRFGVTDRVPTTFTPQHGLHMRHFIGNTGLHDVWILFNESDETITTDLTFLPGIHPASLTDIVTGQQPSIVRAPTGDAIHGISLARWESRMYLSPRADVLGSPLEWLTLQCGWWQGTVSPPQHPLPTPAQMQRFTVDLTEEWAYKSIASLSDDQAAALAQPQVDDSKWERRTLALWLTPGVKSPKRLLLRRKFTVPAHWNDGIIALCADVPYAQFFHETRLFLDGIAWAGGRKTVDGPYFDTMDGAFKPGTTHLLTLDIQSRSSLTGSRGPIWLSYLPNPQDRTDLTGSWTAYSDPLHKTGPIALPGAFKAMFLTRTVVIDPAHRHQNIVIHFEAAGDRFSLMFNGHLLKTAEQVRAHSFTFNVTPLVQFGKENLIELVSGNGANEKSIPLVEIRYYAKEVYP